MKRNRTVLGIIFILIALIIAFLLVPVFNKLLSGKSDVVVANVDIPEGTKITSEMVSVQSVGSYGLPDNVIGNTEIVVGKYATAQIFKNDYFNSNKIENELKSAEAMIQSMDGSRWSVSLNVTELAKSVSANLKSGDIISIIAVDSDQQSGITYPELQYVEVVTVTNNAAVDTADADEDGKTPATVTVLANKRQAELIAKLSTEKSAHIALICRKENELLKEAVLKVQNDFFGENNDMIVISPIENQKTEPETVPDDMGQNAPSETTNAVETPTSETTPVTTEEGVQ